MTAAQFDIFSHAVIFISLRCGIPITVLGSRRRDVKTIMARNILIYILRRQASLTLGEIGLLLDRNSSAVHHALRTLDNDVDTDCAFGRQFAALVVEFSSQNVPAQRPATTPKQ